MFSILLVTQGNLGAELLDAARRITGELKSCEALSLSWDDSLAAATEKVGAAVRRLVDRSGLLILVDMYGGTPCNASMSFLDPGRVQVLAGVNLPMLVRLGCMLGQHQELSTATEWLRQKGQASIVAPSSVDPPSAVHPCKEPTA